MYTLDAVDSHAIMLSVVHDNNNKLLDSNMYYTAKVGRPANELFSTERLNTLHLTRRSKIGRLVSFFTFSFLGMLACTGSAKFRRQRRQKLFSKELFFVSSIPLRPSFYL